MMRPSDVTVASRIMLPWYVVANGLLGLYYLFGSEARFARPGFDLAHLTPGGIRLWGTLFATLSILLAVALVAGSRAVVGVVLLYAALCHGAWGVSIAVSTFLTTADWTTAHIWGISVMYPVPQPDASLFGPMWPLTLAVASIASARSLARDERHVR